MIVIVVMSAQLTTPGLLKLNIFWNKDYGVIISAYNVTNKSCGHVTKFDNSGIYAREVIHNFNFIRIWPEKKNFLRGYLGSSSIIWDWYQAGPWNFTAVWQKD